VIIVFSLNDLESFNEIENWYGDIDKFAPNCKLFFVGNKCDLDTPHIVTNDVIKQKIQSLDNDAQYFEVSAKTGQGINHLFEEIAKTLSTGDNRI